MSTQETAPNAKRPTGVLVVNIGTPDAPETGAVRRYLNEFLSDPRVLDINPLGRWLLLKCIILPFRSPKSAAAYRAVWTDRGSPLLTITEDFAAALSTELGDDYVVEVGMRYGNPSIASALEKLLAQDLERLVVLPQFPQYSSAATGSASTKIMALISQKWNVPPVEIRPDYYANPGFIDAVSDITREHITQDKPDMVLMSYHGLPERHVRKSWEPGFTECTISGPCPKMSHGNRYCYRAQCYETSRQIAQRLGLQESDYTVSFQSRLGRTKWIEPYTDVVLPELYEKGVRKLVILCPSFVADCLETLEEIGIRAQQDWKALGGTSLTLIPCVNTHPTWIRASADMVRSGPNAPQLLQIASPERASA